MPSPTSTRGNPRNIRDFKALYRKLERTLDRIERTADVSSLLSVILRSVVQDFQEAFGFQSGRLYRRQGNALVLLTVAGETQRPPDSYRIPMDYPPVHRILEEGLVIMKRGDPGFDESIEGPIGVSKFAAIAVWEGSHVISFTIEWAIQEEDILYSLSAIRHVINMKLRQEHLAGIINEARLIQESVLPREAPVFRGYEFHGRSRPAEEVGGDLFDYLPISGKLLGVAVADASGHGLPAALLARDVITGLRMGVSEELKILSAVERLNKVIHRSALSSKFVSMFYAELEPNGNLFYVNAGHTPSLTYSGGVFQELTEGGLVLGPNPEASYERGYVKLQPRDLVVMYTDGITECESPSGVEFGLDRLRDLIVENSDEEPKRIVDAIFEAADRHRGRGAQNDDMTVLAIRKN